MAKNYTIAEAVEIINAGTDMESIADLGRRYPILLHKVTKVVAKAGNDFVDLMSYMPDHLTANKVNTSMKNNAGSSEPTDADEADVEDVSVEADVEDENATEEKPVKATKKAAKVAKESTEEKSETNGSDYESMSGKELWEILGKAGKRKDCKERMGGTKKELMIEYINKYGLGDTVVEEANGAEEEVEETETTEATNPYEGKSAMELFKECKKRGIKAAAKKPAKFYVDLLIKADAEATEESEAVEEEDDWGNEAEEPVAKKETKKPAKEAADDDDDWDI